MTVYSHKAMGHFYVPSKCSDLGVSDLRNAIENYYKKQIRMEEFI